MSFLITLDGEPHEIEIVRRRPHLVVRIDGRDHEVTDPGTVGDGRQELTLAGHPMSIARATSGDRQILRTKGRTFEVTLAADGAGGADADALLAEVRAPMPGAVVSLHVAVGDEVSRGQTLVTIESMKLQTALGAPRDGIVAELLVAEGGVFDKDALLIRLETETEEPADA